MYEYFIGTYFRFKILKSEVLWYLNVHFKRFTRIVRKSFVQGVMYRSIVARFHRIFKNCQVFSQSINVSVIVLTAWDDWKLVAVRSGETKLLTGLTLND